MRSTTACAVGRCRRCGRELRSCSSAGPSARWRSRHLRTVSSLSLAASRRARHRMTALQQPDNPLSTLHRQARILMVVHSAPPPRSSCSLVYLSFLGPSLVFVFTGQGSWSLILCCFMSKDFRPWKIDEAQLLPANVQDYVPKDHLCRFILALVREELDLSALRQLQVAGSAAVRSAADDGAASAWLCKRYLLLATHCEVSGGACGLLELWQAIRRTSARYRVSPATSEALAALFVQVLQLAEKAGLVRLGTCARRLQDQANASKHKR